ncbi:hypothetical protein OV079_32285 [Nannocystis pusilla]|uniref:Uncharacterized protein n=1 Tax=Nannocystis pusilla TaxID=889268 RepID=A0A9X3J0L1_9BACT|nr:hypothetical protein [Nannocystis pusilla]MCY1010165.1 hypothetical protein [Nannocystis pusilla]
MIAGSSPRPAAAREAATLLLAGLCFGASQQLVVRELVSLLYGEEVVLLFVSAAALAAASLGYGLGARLSPRALARLLLACGALLLLSPALPRFAVAGLCLLRGDSGPELLLVLALLTFAAAAPFTAVVPALLDRHERPDDRLAALRRGYTCELVGFGLGSTAALALGSAPGLRFAVLAAALVALVHVALDRRAVTLAFAVAAALACATHAPLSITAPIWCTATSTASPAPRCCGPSIRRTSGSRWSPRRAAAACSTSTACATSTTATSGPSITTSPAPRRRWSARGMRC